MGKIKLVRAIVVKIEGRAVGYVTNWSMSEPEVTRDFAFEVGRDGPIPNEHARGAYRGGQIEVERYILWDQELQDAVGHPVDKLTDIMDPFVCEEHIQKPNGTVAVNLYHGCLFSGESRTPPFTSEERAPRMRQRATIFYEYKTRPVR